MLHTADRRAQRLTVRLDDLSYSVEILRSTLCPPEAPRLIMACYNSSPAGVEITRVAIESILRNTAGAFELWLVDNASPAENRDWLREIDGVNVVLNLTPPVPTSQRGWRARLGLRRVHPDEQLSAGSYANAVGLELGLRCLPPETHQVCVLHNDVFAMAPHWLAYLQSRMTAQVRVAAISRDEHPERIAAAHVSGLLFDYQLYRSLNLSMFPDLPRLDVGDRISEGFRAAGFTEFICRNTYNEPDCLEWISEESRLRTLHSVRVFDDDRQVIFLHMGRGTAKASGRYNQPGKTYPQEWVEFARDYLARNLPAQ